MGDEYVEIDGRRYTRDQLVALLGGGYGDLSPWLLTEAIASAAVDRDERARTISLDAPPDDPC